MGHQDQKRRKQGHTTPCHGCGEVEDVVKGSEEANKTTKRTSESDARALSQRPLSLVLWDGSGV